MLKRVLIFSTIVLSAAQVAVASDREDDVSRTRKAAQCFQGDYGYTCGRGHCRLPAGNRKVYCHHSGGCEVCFDFWG